MVILLLPAQPQSFKKHECLRCQACYERQDVPEPQIWLMKVM